MPPRKLAHQALSDMPVKQIITEPKYRMNASLGKVYDILRRSAVINLNWDALSCLIAWGHVTPHKHLCLGVVMQPFIHADQWTLTPREGRLRQRARTTRAGRGHDRANEAMLQA